MEKSQAGGDEIRWRQGKKNFDQPKRGRSLQRPPFLCLYKRHNKSALTNLSLRLFVLTVQDESCSGYVTSINQNLIQIFIHRNTRRIQVPLLQKGTFRHIPDAWSGRSVPNKRTAYGSWKDCESIMTDPAHAPQRASDQTFSSTALVGLLSRNIFCTFC